MKATEVLSQYGLFPIIKIDDAAKAVPLADTLKNAGLPIAEVTFRTDAAAESIAAIRRAFPDMLIGAGTVLTTAQADAAIAAGATFLVTPGFNPRVVRHCIDRGIEICPGVMTPGEMEQAMEMGLGTVKLFPAEAIGGVAFLKAVSGPYRTLKFLPTGGVSADNLLSYLRLPCVTACGGSFFVKDALIRSGDFETIDRMTREALAIAAQR